MVTTATKTCAKCGVEKPLDLVHFDKHFHEWKSWCRECRGKPGRRDRTGRWLCTGCGKHLDLSEFYLKTPHLPAAKCRGCERKRRAA